MRIEKIEVELFEYHELGTEAKAVVKEWILENFREASVFTQDIKDGIEYMYGLELTPQYSLGYCQGDGLSMYGKVDVAEFIIKNEGLFLKDGFTKKELARLVWLSHEGFDILINQSNHRYSHKYCMNFEYSHWLGYCSYKNTQALENTLDKFEEWFKEFMYGLCDKYEALGYEYFYEADESDIQDTCISNGYEFTIDGKKF